MSKSLVFTKSKVEDPNKNQSESWELLSFGDNDIMHAAWNPFVGALVCQFKYHKNNPETIPKYGKKGEVVDYQLRNVDTWYRLTIHDKDAVQAILDNFVVNPPNYDWDIRTKINQVAEVGDEVAVD